MFQKGYQIYSSVMYNCISSLRAAASLLAASCVLCSCVWGDGRVGCECFVYGQEIIKFLVCILIWNLVHGVSGLGQLVPLRHSQHPPASFSSPPPSPSSRQPAHLNSVVNKKLSNPIVIVPKKLSTLFIKKEFLVGQKEEQTFEPEFYSYTLFYLATFNPPPPQPWTNHPQLTVYVATQK